MDPHAIADEGTKCEKDMVISSVDYLPHEVVELILSKCPVKSVVRFKSVSKSWQSTISGPRFSEILESKLSENLRNKFFMWEQPRQDTGVLNLVSLGEDGKFRREAVSGYPSREFLPLCSCNGLILLHADIKGYILWNPFVRKHIKIAPFNPVTHAQAFRDWRPQCHPSRFKVWTNKLYYDSTTDDYKILTVYDFLYTVYSFRDESWVMRELPTDFTYFSCKYHFYEYCDGCIYLKRVDEIEYLDTRDGTVGSLRPPDGVECLIKVRLEEVSGRLCLHGPSEDRRRLELWMLEKNGGLENYSWRRLNSLEKEEAGVFDIWWPLCLSNEDLVVKWPSFRDTKSFVYIRRENSFEKYEFDWSPTCSYFTYSETLYMPSSSNVLE